MAITEKPKKKTQPDTETKAKDFIRKGMGAPEEQESEHEKPVTFRLTEAIIKRIDSARKARRIKTSKQTWFVEAILDKLDQEGF